MDVILSYIPYALAAIYVLDVGARVFVKFTKTTDDDALLAKVEGVLLKLGVDPSKAPDAPASK